jgi:hypothetical protein
MQVSLPWILKLTLPLRRTGWLCLQSQNLRERFPISGMLHRHDEVFYGFSKMQGHSWPLEYAKVTRGDPAQDT